MASSSLRASSSSSNDVLSVSTRGSTDLAADRSSPSSSSTSDSLVPETDSTRDDDNTNATEDPFESFAVGKIYEKKAFVSTVRNAANRNGFEAAVRGYLICCSRAARPNDGPKALAKKSSVPDDKKRKKSSLAVGCKWIIRWQPHKESGSSETTHFIRITRMELNHTNGCNPSPQQLRVTRRRSGRYTREIPMYAIKEVIHLLGDRERIPYSLVRKMLKKYFPEDWVMDPVSICNFLVKCRYFKKEMEKRNDCLSVNRNSPGWIQMENTDPDDFISKASRVASEMLMDTLNNRNNMWEAEQYLESLKTVDRGFDYRICRQNDNRPTGIVWVTSAMRHNYESGGFCLFLDAMKRQQNDIDWPYISVVTLNNSKKVANACEALTCAERLEAYR